MRTSRRQESAGWDTLSFRPCLVSQWVSKFTRKSVESSLGGVVHALGEMADHISSMRDIYAPFQGLNPGMMGLEDCESLFANLKAKKMIAGKNSLRYFSSAQQALEEGGLDNLYWLPGTGNRRDGLTRLHSDMPPLLRLLESGHFNPGSLPPLKGVAWKGGGGRR